MINTTVNIEQLIAKIDNDFNLDNSDWIPRVAAWCIDAMSQLDVLNKVTRTRKLEVKNRIAINPCDIVEDDLKVYDDNGCEVKRADDKLSKCSLTGNLENNNNDDNCDTNGSRTLENKIEVNKGYKSVVLEATDFYPQSWQRVYTKSVPAPNIGNSEGCSRTYVKLDNRRLELNFDTKYITIKNKEIETKYSQTYRTELPVIPNNGILLEALGYYCVYKFLCRGYKHPVFNLSASQYGTNPFYEWNRLKDIAKRSVLNDKFNNNTANFRHYFMDSTFPKD